MSLSVRAAQLVSTSLGVLVSASWSIGPSESISYLYVLSRLIESVLMSLSEFPIGPNNAQ